MASSFHARGCHSGCMSRRACLLLSARGCTTNGTRGLVQPACRRWPALTEAEARLQRERPQTPKPCGMRAVWRRAQNSTWPLCMRCWPGASRAAASEAPAACTAGLARTCPLISALLLARAPVTANKDWSCMVEAQEGAAQHMGRRSSTRPEMCILQRPQHAHARCTAAAGLLWLYHAALHPRSAHARR